MCHRRGLSHRFMPSGTPHHSRESSELTGTTARMLRTSRGHSQHGDTLNLTVLPTDVPLCPNFNEFPDNASGGTATDRMSITALRSAGRKPVVLSEYAGARGTRHGHNPASRPESSKIVIAGQEPSKIGFNNKKWKRVGAESGTCNRLAGHV